MFRLNEMQALDFAKVASRVGILTAVGGQAEIVSSLFSLAMLGCAFHEVYHDGESPLTILREAAKEGGWTGASVASFALLPLPISISVAIALPILRTRVEANGLTATLSGAQEYFGSVAEWVQANGLGKV
jgi:hypothetical protein